ncbi:MAG: hypothetical protein Tsb0017_03640 [Geothermobacteraceae bacterium]
MPLVRRGYRLLIRSVLCLSVILSLQLSHVSPVFVRDLVLGFVPGICGLFKTESQAEALAGFLSEKLGQPVTIRAFKSEKNLHFWLNRFREVDFAVFSADYLESKGRGAFIPLAGYIRKSLECDGRGRLVARRGVVPSLFVSVGNALAQLKEDPLLDQLDVLRFYRAGERPAGLPDAPSVTEALVGAGAGSLPPERALQAGKPLWPDRQETIGPEPAGAGAQTPAPVVMPAQAVAGVDPNDAGAGSIGSAKEPAEPVLELLSPRPDGRTGPTPMLQYHLRNARARILLDGQPLKAGPGDRLGPLADGRHELLFELTGPAGRSAHMFAFEVDATPPAIDLPGNPLPVTGTDAQIAGVSEPGALVRLLSSDGTEVARTDADRQGNWSLAVAELAPGENAFQVVARDVFGNESRTGLAVVRIDEMPQVTILSPKNDAILSTVPTLAFTAGKGEVLVFVDGAPVDDPPKALRALTDGRHEIEVRLRTAWGGEASQKVVFLLDREGPDLVVASPVDGRVYNRPPAVEWGGEAGNVALLLDGLPLKVANGGSLPELSEGDHLLVVTATDTAGNETRREIRFRIDLQGPKLELTAPATLTAESTPVVAWRGEAEQVRLFLDGREVEVANGRPLPKLSDGDHILRLEASDEAGNVQVTERSFVVDTSPPSFLLDPVPEVIGTPDLVLSGTREPGSFIDVVVVPEAEAGDVVYPDGTSWRLELKGLKDGDVLAVVTARDALDNEARREIRFRVDTRAPKVRIVEPATQVQREARIPLRVEADEGELSVSLDGRTLDQVPDALGPLEDGEHLLVVDAVDAAGNRGRAEMKLVVDTHPPEAAILAPGDGDRTGVRPVVDYRVVEGRGRLLLDGRPLEIESGDRLPALEDGGHRLRLEALDEAGNLATVEVHFTVDSSAPRVVLISPATGVTFDPTPVLQFRVDRGDVRVFVDGRPVDKASGDSLDSLAPGEHRVRVEAVDDAGNVGSAERRFVVAEVQAPEEPVEAGPRFKKFSVRLDRRVVRENSGQPLVLEIGPLSRPGETVHIEQWLDANGNGVADAGEEVVQTFRLVDGIGVAGSGVPGDMDGSANRTIRAEFPLEVLRGTGVAGKRFVLLIMAEHNLAEVGFRFADGG